MAGRVQHYELAVADRAVDIFADGHGRDHVVAALQDKHAGSDVREVRAIVGHEGHPGEPPGDLRVGPAEAVGQLGGELRPLGVAHDRRGHGARPAEMIAVEELEQLLDLVAGEAADIIAVVDVARRGADEHQRVEQLGRRLRREDADHRAYRMPDENASGHARRSGDLDDVVRITLERAVTRRIVSGRLGAAGPGMVEQERLEPVLEGRSDEPPHILVAAEAVGEHHRSPGYAADPRIMALKD